MEAVITPPDFDKLEPDEGELQPDHDESLAPWLAPEEDVSQSFLLPHVLPMLALKPREASGAPDVRFSREIHQGMHGKDVIAHKRALSRARPDLYQ